MVTANETGLQPVARAAAYLGVSRAKVYLMMKAGELDYVKIGKSRRVKWDDVLRYVEKNTHRAEN